MGDHDVVQGVLHGRLNKDRWSRPRIVKVFVASTKTDFVEERKQLLEVVGPDLQSELDSLGIEVEIVDIFFGVEDDFTWDSQVMEDHFKEIRHCHDVSRGCFLLCLIGGRYGRSTIDSKISGIRFDAMLQKANEEQKAVLEKHYVKNDDGDYVLQKPVRNNEKWARSSEILEDVLYEHLPDRKSVLESQLIHGLGLSENSQERIVVVMRNWKHLEESQDPGKVFHDDREQGTELLKKYVYNTIPEENRFSFRVLWSAGGIDPDREEHESYLSDFAEVLGAKLHELVTISIKQDPEVKARNKNIQEVYNEAVAHLSLLEKLRTNHQPYWLASEPFFTIKKLFMDAYRSGPSSKHSPVFLLGGSVTGKTSVINAVYQCCESWFDKPVDRIVRLCGSTPRTCYNMDLVRIMCQHLAILIQEPYLTKETNYEPQFVYDWFQDLLVEIFKRKDRVLVILLDDIDRLNPLNADNKAALSWIPLQLPHNVFILATTGLPIDDLKFTESQKANFSVIGQSLIKLKPVQNLDDYQRNKEKLLYNIEKRFGRLALSRLSSLLCCSELGLSETELLEILMPTNDICEPLPLVKGYINFSTLASLKYALGELLVEKQMSGKLLLLWRHLCVKEVAKKRYSSPEYLKKCHEDIANLFFLEFTKAENKEPDPMTETSEEAKDTPFQSVLPALDVTYNIRHVEEAWIHLLKAGSLPGLKDLCVCNFDMALACVQSISIAYFRSLLEHVRSFILDRDLELVYYTLRTASLILTHDPMQLPTQLICWLRAVSEESGKSVFRMVTSAMAWCDGYTEPLLVPLSAWLEPPVPHEIRNLTCKGGIRLMEATPSCQHIVVVPESGDPQLWHIMTNDLVHTFKGHAAPVTCLTITRKDHPYLLTGSEDTTIGVWDLKNFVVTSKIQEHIAPVLCVCAALENTVVVSGGEDSRIIMSNLIEGTAIAKVDHHRGPVTALRVTSSGDVVVSGSSDATICLWAVEPNSISLLNSMALISPIRLMCISDNEVFVLAYCEDNQFYLRTLTTGTELHKLNGPSVRVETMTMACDNQRALLGAADGKVYVVDLHSGLLQQTITTLSPKVTGIRVSKNDDYLIAAGGTKVAFYSFRQDALAAPKKTGPRHHTGRITCITISRDGTLAATGGTDTLVNVWLLNTHSLQHTMEGHMSAVASVSFAPNGIFAVSGGEESLARVWGLTLGLTASVYRKHTSAVIAVEVFFDSRRVLSCEKNGNMAIWLADDATPIQTIPGAFGTTAMITNNMKYIICHKNENMLTVWSLDREDERYLVTHSQAITCFVITADDKQLITGSKDQSLKLWALSGCKLTQVLVGHNGQVTCVAVALNDKSVVISGCRDMNLIVWNVDTGEEVWTLTGHTAPVTCVAISADSLVAVSGSEDKSIVAWDTKKGRALTTLVLHLPVRGLAMTTDASRMAVHLNESSAVPIVCLHNTPASYVKMPAYVAPAKEVQAPDLRPSSGLKRPTRRLLKKEVSLDTYTWQKKYGHLTSNIMMAAVDERLKRRFSVSCSMEEISKISNDQGSQQLGPEQAALAQSQHFDQLEALWNKRSPPARRRFQLSKQNSRQSDPPTPLEEDPGGYSDE